MATLREEAQAYEPPQTLSIADLEKVQIDIELKTGSGTDNKGETFTYKYCDVGGKQYRVPGKVIGDIKAIIKKLPYIKFVSVLRQGAGMNTRYQVIPHTEN